MVCYSEYSLVRYSVLMHVKFYSVMNSVHHVYHVNHVYEDRRHIGIVRVKVSYLNGRNQCTSTLSYDGEDRVDTGAACSEGTCDGCVTYV